MLQFGREVVEVVRDDDEAPVERCPPFLQRVGDVRGVRAVGRCPGAPGELRINGVKTDPKKQYVVNKGDTISLGTPGGGGHGDPRQRDPAALAADIAAGYVTVRAAYR